MRAVRWSLTAQRQRLDWLVHLAEYSEDRAKAAFAETVLRSGQLARRPFAFREARWPGLRERSLTRWKKIMVYQVTDTEVIVTAFYDARQDLARVRPETEDT